MRKKMERLAEQVSQAYGYRIYFTENLVNYDDKYYSYRYFLLWTNTHGVFAAYKTQTEAIEGMQLIIEEKQQLEQVIIEERKKHEQLNKEYLQQLEKDYKDYLEQNRIS